LRCATARWWIASRRAARIAAITSGHREADQNGQEGSNAFHTLGSRGKERRKASLRDSAAGYYPPIGRRARATFSWEEGGRDIGTEGRQGGQRKMRKLRPGAAPVALAESEHPSNDGPSMGLQENVSGQ
jgi:hypothetical protein